MSSKPESEGEAALMTKPAVLLQTLLKKPCANNSVDDLGAFLFRVEKYYSDWKTRHTILTLTTKCKEVEYLQHNKRETAKLSC